MADRLGNAVDSFCDLESYDDEAFTVPTLAELAILGHVVGVEPKELLLGEDVVTAEKTVTLGDIAQQLAHRMADSGITSEQLGREIGFSVEPLLRRRDALWDYSVEALYQICGAEFAPTIVRTSHRQPSRSH